MNIIKEVGEIIMRLKKYYDVDYTDATYYMYKQVFYFNFDDDNSTIVRVFLLEDRASTRRDRKRSL